MDALVECPHMWHTSVHDRHTDTTTTHTYMSPNKKKNPIEQFQARESGKQSTGTRRRGMRKKPLANLIFLRARASGNSPNLLF